MRPGRIPLATLFVAVFFVLVFLFIARGLTFLNFLAVFELAINGAKTAGDDFLSFLNSLGDFPIGIVADADLYRGQFGVIPFDQENDFHRFGSFFISFGVVGTARSFGDNDCFGAGRSGGGAVGDCGFVAGFLGTGGNLRQEIGGARLLVFGQPRGDTSDRNGQNI